MASGHLAYHGHRTSTTLGLITSPGHWLSNAIMFGSLFKSLDIDCYGVGSLFKSLNFPCYGVDSPFKSIDFPYYGYGSLMLTLSFSRYGVRSLSKILDFSCRGHVTPINVASLDPIGSNIIRKVSVYLAKYL